MTEFFLNSWTVFYTVFIALFLFGITVFVHEVGHFLAARRCGLVVKTFSIGFGHALFKWEKDGTLYKIGWIPFGGYVALPQLDPAGMEKIQDGEIQEACPDVSPWKKIAVAFAGPIGNIVLAVLLALAIWLIPGDDAGAQMRPVIGNVETNSAAYVAGLREGDEILSVSGTTINNWYEFQVETFLKGSETLSLNVRRAGIEKEVTVPTVLNEDDVPAIEGIEPAIPCLFGAVTDDSPADRAGVQVGDKALVFNGVTILGWEHFTELVQAAPPGEPAQLTIERVGTNLALTVHPEYNEVHERVMLGVTFAGSSLPWMLYRNPIDQLKSDARMIVRVVKALSNRDEASQGAKSLAGPIAIFGILMFSIKTGLLNTLGLIRLINVNLAILNLLPIPVFDGGHIVFSLWHGITRHKVHAKVQAVLIHIFAVLLIGAMLLITFNDIDRELKIKKFFGRLLSGQTETK